MSKVLRGIYSSALVLAVVAGLLLMQDARRFSDFAFSMTYSDEPETFSETSLFRLAQTSFAEQFEHAIDLIHTGYVRWTDDPAEKDRFLGIGRYLTIGLIGNDENGYEPWLLVGSQLNWDPRYELILDRRKLSWLAPLRGVSAVRTQA